MRFSAAFLDELRARLPVSDVVGRRIKLRKEGREWRGLSPFNAEKTPSFFVNDDKMRWFDFSSQRNGNIFDFVMETEGLTFLEAVERLAAEAGLTLPTQTPEDIQREEKRAGLVEACEWAAAFFEAMLQGREGAVARAYLAGRAIAEDVQRDFRLGYAPKERYALRDHLAGRGVPASVMTEAGLLVHGADIAVPYDRFRDRVMFPIADRTGRIVAFGGRALDKEVSAKYLNSPETPLFHKGGLLYNHHRARRLAADKGTVIAVEGYVDVIALTKAGHPHVVAPLGTALTPDQCDLLWRMAPEPILCFDGDGAGRRAAFKAVDTALPLIASGRSLRFAFLPDGQDPDDLVKTGGAAAITAVLEAARPLVEVLWTREVEQGPLDTPERRAGLEKRLDDLLRTIADTTVRRHYETDMRLRLRSLVEGERRATGPGTRRQNAFAPRGGRGRFVPEPPRGYVDAPLGGVSASLARSRPFTATALPPREVFIAALILAHPVLIEWHAEDLAALDFESVAVARLRDGFLDAMASHPQDHAALAAALDAGGHAEQRRKILAGAERLPHWCLKPETADQDADQELRQALALHRKAGSLHRDLRMAEDALGREPSERNFSLLQEARARLSAFDGTEASLEGFGDLSGRNGADV